MEIYKMVTILTAIQGNQERYYKKMQRRRNMCDVNDSVISVLLRSNNYPEPVYAQLL